MGFTLAEVLVTLAVIGVVAALTIPTLMSNVENAGVASRVKKANSMLNQAVKMYMVDNNCIGDLSACGGFAGYSNTQAGNALKPYFKIAKDCGIAADQGCFATGVTYKLLNGDDYQDFDARNENKILLTDGSAIGILDDPNNCTGDRSRTDKTPLYYTCGWIRVDINGHKGPNQLGRDTFYWYITKSGIVYPGGALDDSGNTAADGTPDCDPDVAGVYSTPGGGMGCAARIMREGKVNY